MTHGADFPEGSRDRRRIEAERLETAAAIEAGHAYEAHAAAVDALVEAGELDVLPGSQVESEEDELAREVRLLFEGRGDIKDSGSVDGAIIAELGFDVCANPELLAVIIDEAKSVYAGTDGQVKLEDILKAGKSIEAKDMEHRQTQVAEFTLADHGVEEWEIAELSQTNPRQLRSIARLLDSPILGAFSERIAGVVREEGAKYTLDEITTRALGIMRRYNHHQVALQEGDPIAIELQRQIMRREDMQIAFGEMVLREEFEIDRPSKDIPNPEEV